MFLKPRRTTLIILFCLSFLAGLWLGHEGWQVASGLIMLALLVLAATRRSRISLAAALIAGLSCGILRGHLAIDDFNTIQSLMGQKTTFTATVMDDPVMDERGWINFTAGSLIVDNQKIAGRLQVKTHYVKLQRGYRVEISGKPRPTIGSKQASMFASTRVVSNEQDGLERMRQRFFAGIRTALPEPAASFALGILVGTRGLVPDWLSDRLTMVGLSHIIAVSGYNLTILVHAAYGVLKNHSKRLALIFSLWLIGGFCIASGFSASIVRATVVSVLSLAALYYGRQVRPMVLIGLAAVLTTLANPHYLWSDLGWQLSFLAFFGILVIAPAWQKRLKGRPLVIKNLALESLAAQITTLPLIMLIFGRLSLVSPLANVLVLPFIPLAMLVGFVAGLAGMLLPAVAGWFSWPAVLLINFLIAVVNLLAAYDWADIPWRLPADQAALIYLVLAVWAWLWQHRESRAHEAKTDKLAG